MTDTNETARGERGPNKLTVFRHELDTMVPQFGSALPAHISADRFARVLMTAVQNNTDLLAKADRRSLWNAAMRAAQDGLLPDGREGAIVLYGAQATWMPMIAGLRKKVRNSGELATWEVHVVHANDAFEYELGDDPFIRHKPTLQEPGPVVAAYSIATLKSGEKSREVMSVAAINKVRDVSKAKNSGPWVQWYEEMCRKVVARRHSKVLPMSTDLDDIIRRDDDLYNVEQPRAEGEKPKPRTLASKLDALAGPPTTIDQPTNGEDKTDERHLTSDEQKVMNNALRASVEVLDERAPEDIAADPTPKEKERLRAYHKALEGAVSSAGLQKASNVFWKDAMPEPGTALHNGWTVILGAHARRVNGDISIADVDNTVREWLSP